MEFDWDPAKAAANKAKHGISFLDATEIFEDPNCLVEPSRVAGHDEERLLAIGRVGSRIVTVIFTDRGELRRLISARRARTDERRRYDAGPAQP